MLNRKQVKMKEIVSISFKLKRRSKVDHITDLNVMSEKNLLIMMLVKMSDYTLEMSTGLHVDLDDWNADAGRMKTSCPNAEELNDGLLKNELILKDAIRLLEKKGEVLSKENIKETFRRLTRKISLAFLDLSNKTEANQVRQSEKSQTFWKSFDMFLKINSTYYGWGKASFEKFHSLQTHMGCFEAWKKKSDKRFRLSFDFFTMTGLCEYAAFIQDTYDLLNSTMKKHLEFFRWFMRWAMAMDYHHNAAFEFFRPKLRVTYRNIIFLTVDEMRRLVELRFGKNQTGLEKARDILLFMCMTGLRYSDVKNLRTYNIRNGRIRLTTIKTNVYLSIELNKFSKAILDKYSGKRRVNDDHALPVISNQKLNKHIKTVCEMAGICTTTTLTQYKGAERINKTGPKYEFISSKTGRATFVCTALSLNISRDTIMKWTGHTDYNCMDPYVDITDQQKRKSMNLFNSLDLGNL
jgi:integrase